MKGVQVMITTVSTCSVIVLLKIIHSSVYILQTNNSMTGRACIRRRSADTNLTDIYEEMNE